MRALRSLVTRRLGSAIVAASDPLRLVLWDGTAIGCAAGDATCTITLRRPRVAWELLVRPATLVLGERFIAGDIDISGDVFAAMRALRAGLSAARRPRRMRRSRDAEAIAFHYDLSNDFYRLFLDERMVYTCAYYPTPDATLDEAQRTKLDVVCRKLQLGPDERFLDLGCGWGALVLWAAAHYGVRARGVTLSRAQAAFATDAIRRAGLADRAEVRHLDWRAVDGNAEWDAVAAVGLAEHVGPDRLGAFFAHVRSLLAPGGRFLNHAITNRPDSGWSDEMELLSRHVFPGGALTSAGAMQTALEGAGFAIDDVENLRAHYARTTREWATRLQATAPAARRLVGDKTYRTWLAYLAAASTAFEAGWIGLHQIVATPVADAARWLTPRPRPALPLTPDRSMARAS